MRMQVDIMINTMELLSMLHHIMFRKLKLPHTSNELKPSSGISGNI